MEYMYWLAALTIAILVLTWFAFIAPRKSDMDMFYKQASEDISDEIKAINTKFKADIDAQVLEQLQAAGISKQQIQALSDQTAEVKTQVATLQIKVKDAAIQHLDSIQQLVDARMKQLSEFADKAQSDSVAYKDQFDTQVIDARTTNSVLMADQKQQFADLMGYYKQELQTAQSDYKQQLNQMFIDSKAELAATVSSQQELQQKQNQISASVLNTLLQNNINSLNSQGQSISDSISALATKQTADFASTIDSKYKSSLSMFTTATDAQVTSAKSAIQSAVNALQQTQIPTLMSQFQQSLQDVILKTQADMQKLLYGYGYRRVWNCSFNIGDNSITPTNIQGVASIVRKSGNVIVIYTCTLPQALSYDYIPVAQILTNNAEPNTLDNAFAVPVTKSIDRQTFSIGVERTTSGNNVSISVALVEK